MEFMQLIQTTDFWVGLLKIIWINILLSGDNAVVIALAARGLPEKEQKQAIILGSGFAVVLLVALTMAAAWLMGLQGLQIIGGLLLLWIGAQLLVEEDEDESDAKQHASLMAAVRTILIADLVMSLDNVIGVAAAAKGDQLLLVLGLAVSIPLVVFGSSLMINIMHRFPFLIVMGAALIGWVGGETIANDVLFQDLVESNEWVRTACAVVGAGLVIAWGRWMEHRNAAQAKDLPA
jgi:YjbE family integral membrane protein